MANSLNEALAKEKETEVLDCFIDDDYKGENLTPAIGFQVEIEDEEGN